MDGISLALVGCGRMGEAISEQAMALGMPIVSRFTRESPLTASTASALPKGAVLIDFSVANAVIDTARHALKARVPMVIGTTGWLSDHDNLETLVSNAQSGIIFGANFSVGVNVLYRIVHEASEMLAGLAPAYEPSIEEAHHKTKRDRPSGTALELQRLVRMQLHKDSAITSERSGSTIGRHRVAFRSKVDSLVLEHEAMNRDGFALGALMAAQWIRARIGFYDFADIFDQIIGTICSKEGR